MGTQVIAASELQIGDVIVPQGMLGRSEILSAETLYEYRVCGVRVSLPDGTTREGKHFFRGNTELVVERATVESDTDKAMRLLGF